MKYDMGDFVTDASKEMGIDCSALTRFVAKYGDARELSLCKKVTELAAEFGEKPAEALGIIGGYIDESEHLLNRKYTVN